MIRRSLPVMTLLLLFWPWTEVTLAQSVPAAIPYAGSIAVDGIPLSGQGFFKFAIIDQDNNTLWSNDGTSATAADPPDTAVTVIASNGLYSLELGNQNQPLTPAVFGAPTARLRVWFSTSATEGFELLTPDRQFVSVPYAHQADSVSGTGTVVKGIVPQSPQGALGVPVRDDVVLVGGGNVVVQPKVGTTNTIEIVGSTGNASAVALNCSTPCVEPAEISGVLAPTQVPELGALGGALTDGQIPAAIARDTEVTTQVNSGISDHVRALNAHNFTSISGALSEQQVPATIARDDEVPSLATPTVNAAISAHAGANDAHALSSFTTGTLADARIVGTIARDSEVTTSVNTAVSAHAAANDAHALSSFTTGTLAEPRIDAAIARDAEVPGLVGATVNNAISAHAGANDAHALSSFTTGTLAAARIDGTIARDAEVTTTVNTAITNHVATANVHPLDAYNAGTLAATRIDNAIARDAEVTTLVGPVVKSIASFGGTPLTNDIVLSGTGTVAVQQSGNTITIVGTTGGAAATDVACTTPCVSSAEIVGPLTDALIPDLGGLSGVLTDAQIPAAIARDAELTWANVAGKPAGFADDTDNTGALAASSVVISVTAAAGVTTQTALCSGGTVVVGGGVDHDDTTGLVSLGASWPSSSTGWSVKVNNGTGVAVDVRVYAVCAAVS